MKTGKPSNQPTNQQTNHLTNQPTILPHQDVLPNFNLVLLQFQPLPPNFAIAKTIQFDIPPTKNLSKFSPQIFDFWFRHLL